jgi:hypothetical protein
MKNYIKVENLYLNGIYFTEEIYYYVTGRFDIRNCYFVDIDNAINIILHNEDIEGVITSCNFNNISCQILNIDIRFLTRRFGHSRRHIKRRRK